LAENNRLCTVLSAVCTGRSQALRETHLRVQVGEAGARERRTATRLRAIRDSGSNGRAGRQRRGGKAAGENSHRNAELLEHLLDGRERWNGGAPGGRSAAAIAVVARAS
jgi:hypothetical protein